MLASLGRTFEVWVAALWAGGLWAVGFLAVPVLFQQLPNRMLAGAVAGHMFDYVAWLSFALGAYLLIYRLSLYGAAAWRQSFVWVTVLIVALAAVGHFGVQAVLQGIKNEVFPLDVMASAARERFSTWHGISSLLYLAQALLALVLPLKAGAR